MYTYLNKQTRSTECARSSASTSAISKKGRATVHGKMAASLLRTGGLRGVKCFQAESWSTLCRAPRAAAYNTKSGGSKKSSKKNSDKKQVKTYFDIEKLVQHKPFEFPKKDVSPPAVSSTAHSSYTVTPEKATSHVAEAVPAPAAGTTHVRDTGPVIEAVPAVDNEVQPVIEAAAIESFAAPPSQELPKGVSSEANVGATVHTVSEAAPVQTVAKEFSKSVAETTYVESATKPVATVSQMEASTEPKTEATPVEAAGAKIVAEVTLAESAAEPVVAASMEAAADIVTEAVTVEAAAPPALEESVAGPIVEDTPVKDVAKPIAEVAADLGVEASSMDSAEDSDVVTVTAAVEPVPEADAEVVVEDTPVKHASQPVPGIVDDHVAKASPTQATELVVEETPVLEPVPEIAAEIVTKATPLEASPAAEPVVEVVTVEPAAEPAADAVAVEEDASPVAESVAAETRVDVTPGHDTVELLDLAPVIGEDIGEKLQEEKSVQMDPIQRLFLDSIRRYSTENHITAESVDAGSEYQRALEEEIAKLQRLYGGGDLTSFPELKFPEPTFDEVFRK